jgi:Flp pilus assembly protein TadB
MGHPGRVVGDGRGWVHVIDPREHGRPLDEREAREFERIVAGFTGPATPRPAAAPEPDEPGRSVGAGGASPLTWRQVVVVLAASAVVAALTAALPTPLNLWAPVAVLVALSLSCVVWGRLREGRGRG